MDHRFDFEDLEHFIEMVHLRLHYHRQGLPVGPHWTDFKAHVVDDMEELTAIVEDAIERLPKAERKLEEHEETEKDKVEEVERERNKACLEVEKLKKRVHEFECEDSTIQTLEKKLEDVQGARAFAVRQLKECQADQAQMKKTHGQEVADIRERWALDVKKWKERFEELPKTWQERVVGDDEL